VSLGDFTLSLGADGSSMRAAEPDVVAAAVVPYPAIHLPEAPGKVHVSTETDIGYASGGYGRQGGVYTTQGVAVSNYPDQSPQPPPNTASKDLTRDQIERSLAAKRLPTGRITHSVAGYLYFPKPSGHSRKDGFHLSWFGETAQARMTVPPAK